MAKQLILTDVGLAKLASATPEDQLQITQVAVGDGNGGYPPLDPSMTSLVNEVWRGAASAPIREPGQDKVLIFESSIPGDVGGFFIREVGLFDVDGDLIAIGQTGVVEKPPPGSGTPLTMTVRLRLALANADQTELIVNDAPYIDHQGLSNRDAPDAHPIEAITGLLGELDDRVKQDDPRLSDAREWIADVVSEFDAEAGVATYPKKWTAERVRQAIDARALGLGQRWEYFAPGYDPERDVNTSYTNTTNRPILVVIGFNSFGPIPTSESIHLNGVVSNEEGDVVLAQFIGHGGERLSASFSFVVPPGAQYRVEGVSSTGDHLVTYGDVFWSELR